MKKILFLLAFAFIGQQAFSQMYIVTVSSLGNTNHPQFGNCYTSPNDRVMTTIDPQGNVTYQCLPYQPGSSLVQGGGSLVLINQEFNSILAQGYKLVYASPDVDVIGVGTFTGAWFFAIPWNPSGLEEVPQTLKNLNIHPNPANEFIDIVLDYNIRSSSEIVIYNEAGYIYHKEEVSNLNKNEPFRLDISRVPAGKYFITIVNDKTYTTAQKLIII